MSADKISPLATTTDALLVQVRLSPHSLPAHTHYQTTPTTHYQSTPTTHYQPVLDFAAEAALVDKSFFVTMLTTGSHYPYKPQEALDRAAGGFGQAKPGGKTLETAYLNRVAEGDTTAQRVWQGLDALGLASRTLFIVVGDHGEAFDESGHRQHGSCASPHCLWVPLVIHDPRLAQKLAQSQVSTSTVRKRAGNCEELPHPISARRHLRKTCSECLRDAWGGSCERCIFLGFNCSCSMCQAPPQPARRSGSSFAGAFAPAPTMHADLVPTILEWVGFDLINSSLERTVLRRGKSIFHPTLQPTQLTQSARSGHFVVDPSSHAAGRAHATIEARSALGALGQRHGASTPHRTVDGSGVAQLTATHTHDCIAMFAFFNQQIAARACVAKGVQYEALGRQHNSAMHVAPPSPYNNTERGARDTAQRGVAQLQYELYDPLRSSDWQRLDVHINASVPRGMRITQLPDYAETRTVAAELLRLRMKTHYQYDAWRRMYRALPPTPHTAPTQKRFTGEGFGLGIYVGTPLLSMALLVCYHMQLTRHYLASRLLCRR